MGREWKFQSSSSPKVYTTQINDASGLLSCDCPGWTVKKLGKVRECKHTKKVVIDESLAIEVRDEQQFVTGGAPQAPQGIPKTTYPHPIVPRDPMATIMPPKATVNGFIEPMLASKMPDGLDADYYSDAGYVMEEKFDGHRIVIRVGSGVVTAWSRLGNVRTLPKHIETLMREMVAGLYDGELLVPGMHSYDVTAGQNSGQEKLVLFDIIETLGFSVKDESQADRRKLLTIAYGALEDNPDRDNVRLAVQTNPSTKIVQVIWDRGGEGAIIKKLTGKYSPGWRSPDWIKCKQELSTILTITGFTAGKSGPHSIVNLCGDNGMETTAKTLDNNMLREFAKDPNSFIGRKMVVNYQEKTPSGKLRHIMIDHLAGEYES